MKGLLSYIDSVRRKLIVKFPVRDQKTDAAARLKSNILRHDKFLQVSR